ncbi:entry exclusion protein TrbK [Ensifer sp. BR816]|uniref:entry exclusion protein TrbK n=1 Tax=Rhizobium sp. (strain BR816) TaxID=1057002 RepID=UPI00036568E3|nr:entry exclusion protein TrbK [Ensifer sp. BR816]
MNRITLITLLLAAVPLSSVATGLIVNSRDGGKPALTHEQRAARERFFGFGRELPPIKDGQEMRPRW